MRNYSEETKAQILADAARFPPIFRDAEHEAKVRAVEARMLARKAAEAAKIAAAAVVALLLFAGSVAILGYAIDRDICNYGAEATR